MAKIMFGAAVTDARGKLAGIVYSKNAAGAYIRQKVSPTQSLTTRRGQVRERITNLSKYWSATLTPEQIAGWNAFAKNNPVTDVFGRTMTLSGIQTFCRLNSNILNVGGTQIDDPPASLTLVGLETITVTATEGAPDVLSVAYTATPLSANHRLSVWATQPLPGGRTFAKPFLRWIHASAAAAASPATILSAYNAKFGTFAAGQRVGIRAQVVDETTGAASTGLYDLVTVS